MLGVQINSLTLRFIYFFVSCRYLQTIEAMPLISVRCFAADDSSFPATIVIVVASSVLGVIIIVLVIICIVAAWN